LWLFQQAVDDLLLEGDGSAGVTQSGIRFRGRCVVLTTGTFLNGLIHIGLSNTPRAGRADPPSISLAAAWPSWGCARAPEDRYPAAAGRPQHRL